MAQDSLDDFTKHTSNRYEAIIVAAKHARRINEELTQIEQQPPAEGEEISKPRVEKILSSALKDVIQGKVKFERPKNMARKAGK